MPDEVLPPLSKLPPGGMSREFLGQLEHSANFALTFGGSDTNIVQRFRHNQQINQYAEAVQQQRAEAQQHLIETSQTAQNLWLGEQKLGLQMEEAQARMAHAEQLAPLAIETKRRQIAASMQAERVAMLKEKITAEDRIRQDRDTAGFLAETKDLDPRSEDFDARLAGVMQTYPFAGENKFVAERVKVLAGRREAHLKLGEQAGAGSAPGAGASEAEKRLHHLEVLRNRHGLDQKQKDYLDSEISKVHAAKAGKPAAPVNAPAGEAKAEPDEDEVPTATHPQTGQKMVFKGGKWQAL